MKYKKKPVVVEAIQFFDNPETLADLSKFGLDPVNIDYKNPSMPVLKIPTLEGIMMAVEGDFIIKGVQGEFYPCKPDNFHKTYEEVEE